MKYICALLSVRDIHAAKAFYQELFGLEVAQDYGRNIAFTCGLALQQDFDWLIGVPSMHVRKSPTIWNWSLKRRILMDLLKSWMPIRV